jgi:AcrR family transcriptional regulator
MDGFTLEAVARECGVTKQGLLYHFPSKDALVFEMFMREWGSSAHAIEEAVALTDDGAAALEAIIRATVSHFAPRLDLFRLVTQKVQMHDVRALSPEHLKAIRPLNDVMYAGATKKLEAERRRGRGMRGAHPRRLAFSAHLAAFGILAMKALVDHFGDPLRYSDEELVDEMCRVFRAAATWEYR